MAEESKIERIETVHKKPIMYYRPNQPDGGDYLKVRPIYTPIPDTSGGANHSCLDVDSHTGHGDMQAPILQAMSMSLSGMAAYTRLRRSPCAPT